MAGHTLTPRRGLQSPSVHVFRTVGGNSRKPTQAHANLHRRQKRGDEVRPSRCVVSLLTTAPRRHPHCHPISEKTALFVCKKSTEAGTYQGLPVGRLPPSRPPRFPTGVCYPSFRPDAVAMTKQAIAEFEKITRQHLLDSIYWELVHETLNKIH